MKKILLKLYYTYLDIKDSVTVVYNKNIISKKKSPVVKSTDETIDKVVNSRVSISRYGDGEFSLMNGKDLMFQPYHKELGEKLKLIIRSNAENHIVGIPNVFGDLDMYTDKSRVYWIKYLNLNRNRIYKVLNINKTYYDSLVTRLYIDCKDKCKVQQRFNAMKKLWNNREIVIIEGEKSRLGIGNDLFSNSKSIERIICPSQDAFSKYTEIISIAKKQDKSKLILLALGPTATVLAYDLAIEGYQAIDIGHIDIEYEWFLQGVIEKCPVKNKYIGEINGGTDVGELNNLLYKNQIIVSIR